MRKKKKLFVDAHCFDKEFQGTQSFVKGLYNAFLDKYPEIEVYFGARDPQKVIKAFGGRELNILKYKTGLHSLRMWLDIPALLRKYHFDFAHFQNMAPFTWRKDSCIYTVTLHDVLYEDYPELFPFLFRKSRSILFRKSIQKAVLKTTVSEYSRQRIAAHYRIQPERITIIPNAVSQAVSGNETFPSIGANNLFPFADYILYVSRIEPRKNQSALIHAWKRLHLGDQGIHLVFIGHHSIFSKPLEEALQDLSAQEKSMIHFLSDVPPEELQRFYKNCRLFVYASLAEGFGIPPLEAAIYERPVICSNQTAMNQYDFFAPYLFDPSDPDQLCDLLQKLIQHPPDRERLRKISENIQTTYNWEMSAERLYQLLTSKSS